MVLGVVVLAAAKAATILFTVVPGPAGMAYNNIIIIRNIILSRFSTGMANNVLNMFNTINKSLN